MNREVCEIGPEYFFEFEFTCPKWQRKWGEDSLLPSTSSLFGQDSGAAVSVAYDETGLYFFIEVEASQVQVKYPDFQKGDSVELFIDTKNLKNARTTHRFCHHFYILPERVEGHMMGECTRFRTEDSHPLCQSEELEVKVVRKKSGYKIEAFIPEKALIGFQPEAGSCLGFCYRINRSQGATEQLGLPLQLAVEQAPYLWPTLKLKSAK
jgi:hypothetical protein